MIKCSQEVCQLFLMLSFHEKTEKHYLNLLII